MQNNEREVVAAVSNRKISAALSACLLEVAAKHISKSTAITSVQWHAIYMALPREINFEVTTHKINNSERNSGHSSKERNGIITGRELQYSASPAEEFSLSGLFISFCLEECFFLIRTGHFDLHV